MPESNVSPTTQTLAEYIVGATQQPLPLATGLQACGLGSQCLLQS